MLSKPKPASQLGFYSTFEEQLSHSHPLYILAYQIQWNIFEEPLRSYIHKKDVLQNLSG